MRSRIILECETATTMDEMELSRKWLEPHPDNHNPLSPRMVFQWNVLRNTAGKMLNVGCSSDPLRFGSRCDHFDLDDWSMYYTGLGARFIQGDVHHLSDYVGPKSYYTVLLGDVVEHLVDPVQALAEACLVATHLVAFTIWEEWRLPGPGLHIEEGQRLGNLEVTKFGYETYEEMQDAEWPERRGYPDTELPHLVHIWQFTDEMVVSMLVHLERITDFTVGWFAKVPEVVHEGHAAHNWLVVMHSGLP